MNWKLRGFNNPMDHNYHAETDESDFLVREDISKYCMMVSSLNWLITLGRYDMHYTTTTLVRQLMLPRQGHMHAMKRAFGYLQQNRYFSIDYGIEEPDFIGYQVEKYGWFPLYGEVQEEVPYVMPEPKGKAVLTSGFFDSSHASCLVTR
eukprot:12450564-Ditylum_brightwellii.AAC.1